MADRMRDVTWQPGLGWFDPKSKSVWSPSLNGWINDTGVFYDGQNAKMANQLDDPAVGGRVMAISKKIKDHLGGAALSQPPAASPVAAPPQLPGIQATPTPPKPYLGSPNVVAPVSAPAPSGFGGGSFSSFGSMRNGFGG